MKLTREDTRPLRIIFVGEKYHPSSPSVTLARVLSKRGIQVDFSEGIEIESTFKWLRMVSKFDAMIVVSYDGPSPFRLRQIALASAAGVMIFRWWVGSDVLYCLKEPDTRYHAQLLDQICSLNVAVAPHLQNELSSIGIDAVFIPSVLDDEDSVEPQFDSNPSKVLVYLPSARREFYGFKIVRKLIEKFSHIGFVIVGDDEHSLLNYPNVSSLGWVDDMQDIWPEVRCLLRITEHDGMPRFVLEALRREKYVVYSWPLEGCYLARDYESASKALLEIYKSDAINKNGLSVFNAIMLPPPEIRFAEIIEQKFSRPNLKLRFKSLTIALQLYGNLRVSSS